MAEIRAIASGDGRAGEAETLLNVEENAESLNRILAQLSQIERDGTLQAALELLSAVKLLKTALTDDMIVGLVQRLEQIASVATDPVVDRYVSRLPNALRAAHAEESASPKPMGIGGMIRALRDPDVQRALGVALRVAKHMGESVASEKPRP